jgi:hypothetical protein
VYIAKYIISLYFISTVSIIFNKSLVCSSVYIVLSTFSLLSLFENPNFASLIFLHGFELIISQVNAVSNIAEIKK